mmetsp:Transcript_33749/g.66991  ORF Transcript_33749/g.66991 Transcript_33749/m.66991 type:complete len:332 (+) Transcript_33749:167-1162(+)
MARCRRAACIHRLQAGARIPPNDHEARRHQCGNEPQVPMTHRRGPAALPSASHDVSGDRSRPSTETHNKHASCRANENISGASPGARELVELLPGGGEVLRYVRRLRHAGLPNMAGLGHGLVGRVNSGRRRWRCRMGGRRRSACGGGGGRRRGSRRGRVRRRSDRFRACDVLEDALAAEAAFRMQTICPTAKDTGGAAGLPVMRGRGLAVQGEHAGVLRGRDGLRARDVLERPHGAEAALHMDPVRVATEFAHAAVGIPIVRHHRLGREGADLLRGARDVLVGAHAAEAALFVHPIGETTMHPLLARRVPEVRRLRLVGEGARRALRRGRE